jgi:hypothetical protein
MGIFQHILVLSLKALESILKVLPHQTDQNPKTHPKKASTMPKQGGKKTGMNAGPSKATSVPSEIRGSMEGQGSSSSHQSLGTKAPKETILAPSTGGLADMM